MRKKSFFIVVVITLFLISVTSIYAASSLASSSVYYDKSTSGSTKTNVQDAIDDLYTKTKYISLKKGDYVKMTPTNTSFKIPKTLTGYSTDQTVNPSELTLWRVLVVNSDGTVDMISEYVSSTNVYFTGLTGFTNVIGTLNYIAKAYENNKFTVSSRHFGYSTQTEYLTNTSKISSTPPWSAITSDNSNETVGGGDILYLTDMNLVNATYGNLIAKKVGTTTAKEYWINSRGYFYFNVNQFYWGARMSSTTGVNTNVGFYGYESGSLKTLSPGYSVRPILTLGTNLKASGSGTSASPYVLS